MFNLTLVTPEKKVVVDQEAVFVTVPAYGGEVDLLPGHAPMITTLETGLLTYKLKGTDKVNKLVVSWGYCQVSPHGVNILADYVQSAEEINVEAAKKTMDENTKKLATQSLDDEQFREAQGLVARSQTAIGLANKPH